MHLSHCSFPLPSPPITYQHSMSSSCQNIHLLQRQQEVQSISHLFTHTQTHTRTHTHAHTIGKHMLLTHHSRRCGVMLSPPLNLPLSFSIGNFAYTVCTVVQCSEEGGHFAGHVTKRPPPQRPHCTAAKCDGAAAAAAGLR